MEIAGPSKEHGAASDLEIVLAFPDQPRGRERKNENAATTPAPTLETGS